MPVLVDHQTADQARPISPASNNLVSHRCPCKLAFALAAGQHLAAIEPHDRLGGDHLHHLAHVEAHRLALLAALRTRPLLRGNEDEILDPAQPGRRGPSHGRLLGRRRLLRAPGVLGRGIGQRLVGLAQFLVVGRMSRQLAQQFLELLA